LNAHALRRDRGAPQFLHDAAKQEPGLRRERGLQPRVLEVTMRLQTLTVADVMSTAVIALHSKDALSAADLEMRLARIRHLPVLDDKNHVVGILSNRDLFRGFGGGKSSRPVHEIMTKTVVTVREDMPAHQAAQLMLERKIGALPVIGDDQQLVGIVTETDFLRIAHRALTGRADDIEAED
jgi:CBS domain-containing membrane protein